MRIYGQTGLCVLSLTHIGDKVTFYLWGILWQ